MATQEFIKQGVSQHVRTAPSPLLLCPEISDHFLSTVQDAGGGPVMKTDGKHMYRHVTAPVALS